MQGDPGMPGQPGADRGVFVGGVVVDHRVQLPAGGATGDLTKNGWKLYDGATDGMRRSRFGVHSMTGAGSECFEPDRPRSALPTGHVILVGGRPLPTPMQRSGSERIR